jgi:hypothetical protein
MPLKLITLTEQTEVVEDCILFYSNVKLKLVLLC